MYNTVHATKQRKGFLWVETPPEGGGGECHVKGLGMPMLVKKNWIKHGSSFILPLEMSKYWTDFFQ